MSFYQSKRQAGIEAGMLRGRDVLRQPGTQIRLIDRNYDRLSGNKEGRY
jgi:hypothetical protein